MEDGDSVEETTDRKSPTGRWEEGSAKRWKRWQMGEGFSGKTEGSVEGGLGGRFRPLSE